MGHWVQKCFQLHGYPSGHPKTRMHSGPISNHHKGFSAANQVSEVSHNDEVRPMVSLSETQLKQLLSLLNNHDDSSSSKENAVTKQVCPNSIPTTGLLTMGQQIILLLHPSCCIKIKTAHYHLCCCLAETKRILLQKDLCL